MTRRPSDPNRNAVVIVGRVLAPAAGIMACAAYAHGGASRVVAAPLFVLIATMALVLSITEARDDDE